MLLSALGGDRTTKGNKITNKKASGERIGSPVSIRVGSDLKIPIFSLLLDSIKHNVLHAYALP